METPRLEQIAAYFRLAIIVLAMIFILSGPKLLAAKGGMSLFSVAYYVLFVGMIAAMTYVFAKDMKTYFNYKLPKQMTEEEARHNRNQLFWSVAIFVAMCLGVLVFSLWKTIG